jgi:hypothetical protein
MTSANPKNYKQNYLTQPPASKTANAPKRNAKDTANGPNALAIIQQKENWPAARDPKTSFLGSRKKRKFRDCC